MLREQAKIIPRVIDHFPEHLRFEDIEAQRLDGSFEIKTGRVIFSGGEALIPDVREMLLYPALERLNQRYGKDGVKLVIQTAGDFLDERVLEELLERNIWTVSISSLDDFHKGMENGGAERHKERLLSLFEKYDMTDSGLAAQDLKPNAGAERLYNFFGATPDAWIGKLWPSGRAWEHGLSSARYADNFCNNWSGALGFLDYGRSGSEVAIDANGDVYPCCRKTSLSYGNLTEEPLMEILQSLSGAAPFEALATGAPERMGLSFGVSCKDFRHRATVEVEDLSGGTRIYSNPCIGCDSIHQEFMAPLLKQLAAERAAKRG